MKKSILLLFVAASVVIASCGDNKKKEKEDAQKKEDSLKAVEKEKAKADSIKAAENSIVSLDKKYKEDVNGQWADQAQASSSYAKDNKGKNASWSAEQMIGEPDVTAYGDNGKAWASLEQDKGEEWVKLTFKKPVFATEIRARMTYNPGAISKIEVFNQQGKPEVVWQGADKKAYKNKMDYFVAQFEKTKYPINKIKITLDSKAIAGWNEIDAVQLVGTEK
jgi:hypothetical protein